MTKLYAGKKCLIMGVANEKSLAWAIAEQLHEMGAELYFTYQSDVLLKRLQPLAESIGMSANLVECDVSKPESVRDAFAEISKRVGTLDCLVHSIGFSDKNELKGRYVDTSRGNFLNTMDVSVFSFVDALKHADHILADGASALTLSYIGAEKAIPNYNAMGVAKAALEASVKYLAVDFGARNIRVNAISAGPIKTLAAMGIANFSSMLKAQESVNPLKRSTTQADVAKAAAFLLCDLGSGVTGEVLHVDCGFHAVGINLEQ